MLSNTFSDILSWMNSNKLLLNPSKTEFLLIGTKQQRLKFSQLTTLSLGNDIIPVSSSARNLGIIFDSDMSFTDQINSLSKSCHFHIRDIRRIRHLLPLSAATALANWVWSRYRGRFLWPNSECQQIPARSGHGISDTDALRTRAGVFMAIISRQRHPHITASVVWSSWLMQRLWRGGCLCIMTVGRHPHVRFSGQQAMKRCIKAYQCTPALHVVANFEVRVSPTRTCGIMSTIPWPDPFHSSPANLIIVIHSTMAFRKLTWTKYSAYKILWLVSLQIHQNLNTLHQYSKNYIGFQSNNASITNCAFLHIKRFKFSNLPIFTIVFLFLLTLCLQDHLIHRFCPSHMSEHLWVKGPFLSLLQDSGTPSRLTPVTRYLFLHSAQNSKPIFSS